MRTIKIYCKECEVELTNELIEISESDLCWEDREDIMPENNFSIVFETQIKEKSLFVSIDDYNLKDHPDSSRFQGCCGSAGCKGLNKLCLNGHEVATEISDCWTSHYIKFCSNSIIVKQKNENNSFEEIHF
jgi:hypothetical protein